MHPSFQKAYEILAKREAQEAEFEQWRAAHADELEQARHERLVRKDAQELPMIYKTREDALVQPAPPQEAQTDAWDAWLQRHLESFAEVLGEEAGKDHAALEKKIKRLNTHVARLRLEVAKLKAKPNGA